MNRTMKLAIAFLAGMILGPRLKGLFEGLLATEQPKIQPPKEG